LSAVRREFFEPALTVLAAATTFVFIAVPKSLPVLLPIAVLFLGLIALYDRRLFGPHLWHLSKITAALWVAGFYVAINAGWSLDSAVSAYKSVVTLLALPVLIHIANGALFTTPPSELRSLGRGFVAGYMLGALFLSFEVVSFQLTHRTLIALGVLSQYRTAAIDGASALPPFLLNPCMVVLVLLLWPACLTSQLLDAFLRGRALAAIIVGLTVTAVLTSQHATSKIALAGGACVFGLQTVAPRVTNRLMIASWLFACIAAVPLAELLYRYELYNAAWLAPSARHRIVIWGVTSELFWNAPWLGAGVNSARVFNTAYQYDDVTRPGVPITISTDMHAHSAYLQVWFEGGLVGACILAALGLAVLQALHDVPRPHAPAFCGTFATGCLLAATYAGIWRPEYLMAFGAASFFVILAGAIAASTCVPQQQPTCTN